MFLVANKRRCERQKLTDDAIATKLIDRILRMALSGLLASFI
jgi:hypothetical protein